MSDKETVSHRLSLSYTDQGQWVQIQRTTFTNWVNEQLRPLGVSVDDLRTDFADGVKLVALVEALTGRGISGAVMKPSNQYQKLQNVTVSLDVVAKDGVKIVNIDSSDIIEGNIKLILALIWQLVLRYQVGLATAQHKRWILTWLRAVIPECNIKNLTTDWNNGVALHALLEFCKPGTTPNWRHLDKNDKVDNCRKAMELANQLFKIPLVLRPEDLGSPQLDEKSAILYLSYFTRQDGPGYIATRDRIQSRLKTVSLKNLTSDWNDGKALAELVTSSGGNVPGWPQAQRTALETLRVALESGRELGIEPLLTAEELEKEDQEHLGIMAYTAQYLGREPSPRSSISHVHFNGVSENTHVKKVELYDDDRNSSVSNASSSVSMSASASQNSPTFQLVRKPSIRTPYVGMTSDSALKIDRYSVGVVMDSKITGTKYDPELFKVEAEAPSGRIIRMTGNGHYAAQFTPDEIGRWRVSMYYNNRLMDGCPIDVCDPSQVRVRDLRGGLIGKQQTFYVDCTNAGLGDLGVEITHARKRIPVSATETSTPRLYKISYTPYDPGPHEINVHFNGAEVRDADFHSTDPEERQRRAVFNTSAAFHGDVIKVNASCDWEIDYVTGGPFVVHVTDSSDVQVYGMKDGTVCSSPELIADCTKVGDGSITAEVTRNGLRYPCKIKKDQPGIYHISFKPNGPGVYKTWISYDGLPVKGSPFVQEIAELGSPLAHGDGLHRGVPGRPMNFTIDTRGHPGQISVDVIGPSQHAIPCQLDPQTDGTIRASYVAKERGVHTVDVRLDGKHIDGSPFKPSIADPDSVRVSGGWRSLMDEKGIIPLRVNKEKQLPFDASEAGPGELSAEVRSSSGRIPVTIDARNDGRHTVIFTPREEGKHYIDVKWGGFSLQNSPYEGFATWEPEPVIQPEHEIVTLKQIPLQSSMPIQRPIEKDIIPLTVNKVKEIPFDTSKAGPGHLNGRVQGPSGQIPVVVDNKVDGKPTIIFTPEEEGKHIINVDWNGAPLGQSPFIGYATRARDNNNNRYPPVVMMGRPVTNSSPREEDKEIIPLKVHKEKQLPFDTTQAGPGRLTAAVRGPTKDLKASVEDTGDGKPIVYFTPQEEGKHNIDVHWNGTPISQSPFIGYATKDPDNGGHLNGLPPVYLAGRLPRNGRPLSSEKDIIPLKVNQQKALPFDATMAPPGHMTASVRGPSRDIPVAVEDQGNGRPILYFTPEEEGQHNIDVKWNGVPIVQSPVTGYATRDPDTGVFPNNVPPVYLAGHRPSGKRPYDDDVGIIPLKVKHEKQLPFDATDAGPGTLKASVRGPTKSIPVNVEDRKNGKPTVHFTPEEEGKHHIDVRWNGVPVYKSPFAGYATRDPEPIIMINDRPSPFEEPEVSIRGSAVDIEPYRPTATHVLPVGNAPVPLKVTLSGRGLKEAEVDKPAVFKVDGTQAFPGVPSAHLDGVKTSIPVSTEPVLPQVYRCTYVPKVPGAYKLHVKWNDSPLRGSPFKVNVRAPEKSPPRGVVKGPDNSQPRHVGNDVEFKIDHPDHGKLKVICTDPTGTIIPCRFLDNLDGTQSLKMVPKMPGRHIVDIRYNDKHIAGKSLSEYFPLVFYVEGSPYTIDISAKDIQGKVRVWGPGIMNGVLSTFESNFWVDTTGAGAGELRVRIMGPKGAFHVKMRKASQKEKLYQCFYDPVGVGLYTISVQWSGVHVEGSPFSVMLAHSARELETLTDDRLSRRSVSNMAVPSDRVHDFLY